MVFSRRLSIFILPELERKGGLYRVCAIKRESQGAWLVADEEFSSST